MTLSEFKAWFEGFTETLEGPPDAKQWKRIQARVKEITGNPITERVYIDRYREILDYPAYPRPYRAWFGTCNAQNGVGNAVRADQTVEFNSIHAMRAAGTAEAKTLAA